VQFQTGTLKCALKSLATISCLLHYIALNAWGIIKCLGSLSSFESTRWGDKLESTSRTTGWNA